MAQVKFSPSDSEKVIAQFAITFDELPDVEVGGGYIGKTPKGVVAANLNPPFARNAGILPATAAMFSADGEAGKPQPTKAGMKAAEDLKSRILKIWDVNGSTFGTFGL